MGVAAEANTARATGTLFGSTHTPFSCSRVNANGLARTRSVAVMMTRGERVMTSFTRGAVEQLLVEVLDLEVAAADLVLRQAPPARGRQHLVPQILLGVVVEEARREALEGLVPMQRVIGRGEGTAGHRRDEVDLIEQRAALAVGRGDGDVAQRLEHAVRKGRRTFAAAGEREHHEQLVRITVDPGREHGRRQRHHLDERLLACRHAAAGGEGERRAGEREPWRTKLLHAPQYTGPSFRP